MQEVPEATEGDGEEMKDNEEPPMTQADINCYRVNYNIEEWEENRMSRDPEGWITLPFGVLYAVRALCDEVERLNGWKK